MAPLGFIEVLDAKKRVSQRIAVHSFPVTLGRAYTNQIILDDPFVCPRHLTIGYDEAGRLVARDLHSINGLRQVAGGKCAASLVIQSGSEFHIGHTHLRYCETGQAVAPAVFDRPGNMRWCVSPLTALASGLVVLLVLLLSSFFGSYERLNVARTLSESLTTLSVPLVWAGMWALVSRVVVSRFHYGHHFALACAAILLSLAVNIAAEWFEFVLPSSNALWVSGVVASSLILAMLVYGHLGLASSLRRRSRLWAGLGVSAAVIGLGVIADYANRSAFSTEMEFSGVLKPIDSALLPAASIDRFIESTEQLKKELEDLAEKARSSQR